jgi:hypothetical protein
MEYAAKNGEYYHLWWHPHNFGNDPKASMKELELLITHYKSLQDQYGMQSLSMKSIGDEFRVKAGKTVV